MKRLLLSCAVLGLTAWNSFSAVLPAEKLLPDNTLLYVSLPDCGKLRTNFDTSLQGQFWSDPNMKPFKDNFLKKFSSDVVSPVEKELGINFSDFKELAQGQFAFAFIAPGPDGQADLPPYLVLLLYTK
jgi:hypothetical protein